MYSIDAFRTTGLSNISQSPVKETGWMILMIDMHTIVSRHDN